MLAQLCVCAIIILSYTWASLKLNYALNTNNHMEICSSVSKISEKYPDKNILLLSEEVSKSPISEMLLKSLNKPKYIISTSNLTKQEGLFILFGQKGHSYKEVLEKLSLNSDSKFLIIWLQPDAKVLDVQILFSEFWSFEVTNAVSLVEMKYGGIYLYTYYPYTTIRCSDPGPPVFLDSWNSSNQSFVKNIDIFTPKKVSNLQSCPLQCSGTHTPPDSIITDKGNNTYEFLGLGGLIFNFISQHLNFTPVITRVTDTTNSYEGVYSNDTSVLVKDIISRKVDIGFGKFSRSTDMQHGVTFAKETGVDCFTWAVPFRAGKLPSMWKTFTNEFYTIVWILILISLISAVLILFILSHVARKERNEYRNIIYVVLFIISTFLSSQLRITPSSNVLRVFVVHWFLYSLVIIAAYQASLGSIVTVPPEISNLKTINDILQSQLSITGSPQMYYVLNASTSTTGKIKELLKRFEVQPPGEFLPVMKRVVLDRNVVVFANQRLLTYSNLQLKDLNITEVKAYIVQSCLIKSPSSPMLLRNGSPYRIPIDNLLSRLLESGIIEHWAALHDQQEDNNSNVPKFTQLHFRHLRGAFTVLLTGELIAAVVFILELICNKWFHFMKKSPVIENEEYAIPYLP